MTTSARSDRLAVRALPGFLFGLLIAGLATATDRDWIGPNIGDFLDARFGSINIGIEATFPNGAATAAVGGDHSLILAHEGTAFSGAVTMHDGPSPTFLVAGLGLASTITVLDNNGGQAFLGGPPSFDSGGGLFMPPNTLLDIESDATAAFHGCLSDGAIMSVNGTLRFHATNCLRGLITGSGTVETADGVAVILHIDDVLDVDMPTGVFELDRMWVIEDGLALRSMTKYGRPSSLTPASSTCAMCG